MLGEVEKIFYFGQALQDQGHVFVHRHDKKSRHSARDGVREVLTNGDRLIVFPEGRASSGIKRLPFKPFCFHEVARQDKTLQACVFDYSDKDHKDWDIKRNMIPQLIEIIGRRKTKVRIKFFEAQKIEIPEEAALYYHDMIENQLKELAESTTS